MTLFECIPSLRALLEETDAEDAAGEAGELVGRDDSVPRISVAELKAQARKAG
jgi:hypothetical protein